MKVLLVANLYPPVIGGTERHVQNLARELVRRGHDVAVATMCPVGAARAEVDEFGVRVYRIDRGWFRRIRPHEPVHPPLADRGVSAALRTIMAAECPDVVYAHSWILYSYLAAAGRRAQVPVLACLHDYWPLCPDRSLYSGGHTCRHDTLSATLRCAVRAHRAKGLALGVWLWNCPAPMALPRRSVSRSVPVCGRRLQTSPGRPAGLGRANLRFVRPDCRC